MDTKTIASITYTSIRTVQNHRNDLLKKFEQRTVIGLLVQAIKYPIPGVLDVVLNTKLNWANRIELSKSERIVLHRVLQGKTSVQIAELMNQSKSNIDKTRGAIRRKWKITSNSDLVRKAINYGYLKYSLIPSEEQTNGNTILALYRKITLQATIRDMTPLFTESYEQPAVSLAQEHYLMCLFSNMTCTETADKLQVTKSYLYKLRMQILSNLKAKSIFDLVLICSELGLITLEPNESTKKPKLSDVESNILWFLTRNTSQKDIARQLNMNSSQVNSAVSRIKRELESRNFVFLFVQSIRSGVITV